MEAIDKDGIQLSGVDIYYNYAFDLGHSIIPIDAARQLLKTGVGQSFRNPITRKTEIADSYKSLVEEYAKYLQSSERVQKEHEDLIQYAKKKFFDLEGWLILQEQADRKILSDDYAENAFVRVGLQKFTAKVQNYDLEFDVTLTIHRAGIALLTVYALLPGTFSPEQVLAIQKFSRLDVQECIIPTPIAARQIALGMDIQPMSEEQIQKLEAQAPSGHKGVMKFTEEHKIEFTQILEGYRYFVIECIQGKTYNSYDKLAKSLRSLGWQGYPIVFVKRVEPGYASCSALKAAQPESIAKLIARFSGPSSLKPAIIQQIFEADLSISDGYSLYITEASTTVIYAEGYDAKFSRGNDTTQWAYEKFLTSTVIDLLLLQTNILSTFNFQLEQFTYDLRSLIDLKRQYTFTLAEFEVLWLSQYGDVSDIIKTGQEIFRVNDLRQLFLLRLENIESLISAAESEQRTRRDRRVGFLTTLVAIIFALQASNDVVTVLKTWSPSLPSNYPDWMRGIYGTVLGNVTQHPVLSIVILYITVVGLTLLATWYSIIEGRRRGRKVIEKGISPKSSEAVVSPTSVLVQEADPEDPNNGAKIGR